MRNKDRRRQAPEHTRKVMRANRSRDTKPELALRRELHRRGVRYRVHAADVPGRPDLVIRRLGLAVFVDGDFWHGNRWRLRGLSSLEEDIASNHEYWVPKIRRNIERDEQVNQRLEAMGWTVLRVWESEVNHDPAAVADRVQATIDRLRAH